MSCLRIFFAATTVFLLAMNAQADERKVIIDLRSDSTSRIEARLIGDLKDMRAHYAAEGHEFKAVVVISGRAYKFFVEDLEASPFKDEEGLPEINEGLVPLMQELVDDYGVDFQMCTVGMRDRGIKKDALYPFVNAEKSQPILMVDYQNAGYAYLPIF
jgi:intracellular sulfur oxidation DsrE/DsrF family protein